MDLLKDNLKKLYLRFLILSLGSAMVMSIYTLTDAIVIGKGVGSDALAALSIITPLLCILMAMGRCQGVILPAPPSEMRAWICGFHFKSRPKV